MDIERIDEIELGEQRVFVRADFNVPPGNGRVARRGMGFLMHREVETLDRIRRDPADPFVVVLGGAKVADKIGIIRNLLDKAAVFLIGGAMTYTFMHARGGRIGASPIEADRVDLAREIIRAAVERGTALLLPGLKSLAR